MTRIAILGSTGSIGRSALSVVHSYEDRLSVIGMAAGENVNLFAEQIIDCRPCKISMATPEALAEVQSRLKEANIAVESCEAGIDGLLAIATDPDVDIVLCATAGTAALDATLAAIEAGKTIALANKEVLVMAGDLMTRAAKKHGASILPVDSEHNAIQQCLHGRGVDEVRRLVLTASGGPFRDEIDRDLEKVTPEEALNHPTWNMGPKITIDSATLMNKGLEVIEAYWLFGLRADQIDVLVHPQSVIHSLVELRDGSMIAQLGVTDMRLPIQYTFSYPERWDCKVEFLDLTQCGSLSFASVDRKRFPCLDLAYHALRGPASLATILNAANERAVGAFLNGNLTFSGISTVINQTLEAGELQSTGELDTLDRVREVDSWARQYTDRLIGGLGSQ